MKDSQPQVAVILFFALGAFCAQGCSGGSSGGGGGAAAPVNTASSTSAPIPSGASVIYTDLGLQGNENVFPSPLSNSGYQMTRSGYANLSSGTVTWHPDNGAVLHVTAFNEDRNQGDSIAWLQLLEISTLDQFGQWTVIHSEDFRRRRSRSNPISGAWYSHTSGMWFAQQVTGNSGVFGTGRDASFGVPMWISDSLNPQRVNQAAHIWITPFPRVRITSGVRIQIRAKFIVYGGGLLYFGLDRWPTRTDTASNQIQAQAKVEQVMLSQTYDSRGGEAHYDIRLESPLTVLSASDPNPPKQDPQPGQVTPITHAVLGTP